jgi:hypothetical protein
VADGRKLLQMGCDLLGAHHGCRPFEGGETLGVVEVDAFWAFQVDEVTEGLLGEGQQCEYDAWRIVPCRLRQVGS